MPDIKFWFSLVGLCGSYTIAYWTWHAVAAAWQVRQERKKLERMAKRAARELQRDRMAQQKKEDAHYAGVQHDLIDYAESLFSERK